MKTVRIKCRIKQLKTGKHSKACLNDNPSCLCNTCANDEPYDGGCCCKHATLSSEGEYWLSCIVKSCPDYVQEVKQ